MASSRPFTLTRSTLTKELSEDEDEDENYRDEKLIEPYRVQRTTGSTILAMYK